jgi:hypothetical protein
VADLLVAEVDHLVAEERVLDLLELLVAKVGEIDTPDLRPHRRGQRHRLDVLVGLGGVVEPASGVCDHSHVLDCEPGLRVDLGPSRRKPSCTPSR